MLKSVVGLCLLGVVVCGPPVSRSREEIQKFRDFLESTRTEAGVILPTSDLGDTKPNAWVNSGKYQGDMLLDDEQIESMVQQFSAGRNGYILPNTQWPSASIPYEFAPGNFDDAQRDFILQAMNVIEENTCIRFHPRQDEFNYVRITGQSNGCYASVGYWPTRGMHTLNVARDVPGRGCLNAVVIVHEWLHVIGFFHMQSTYNRDDYVRINWENVQRGMEHNFARYDNDLVSNLGLPYEYESCMHYGTHGFSINGRPTLEALHPHEGQLGQTDYVTEWDFLRVDRLYNCSAWKTVEDYKPFPNYEP